MQNSKFLVSVWDDVEYSSVQFGVIKIASEKAEESPNLPWKLG
jgi:hypothetical protein